MPDLNDLTTNVNIWNDAKTKSVTVTTDGAKERLDVDAKVTGASVTIAEFIPKNDFSVANIELNTSTDTTLLSFTGKGKLDFIVIDGTKDDYEIVIDVDGSEVYRISMDTLTSILGLTHSENLPIWTEKSGKNFRFHPNEGVDFTTSFTVKAKATGTPLPKVNWLVNYREST